MMSLLVWTTCVAACSIGFRIRGGVLAQTNINLGGGQMSRLVFAAAAGLTAWAGGAVWWLALATVPAWWVASTFPLFGGIDLGTRDDTVEHDVAALVARGALWTILPAMVLLAGGFTAAPVLFAVGILMPFAYWLGKQSGIKAWGVGKLDWQQTGEAFYGAMLGLGVLLAVTL